MANASTKRVRLGDVCCQIRGVSYKPKDARDDVADGYVPLLRANNIGASGLNHDEMVYVRSDCVQDAQFVRRGDLLICASSGSRRLVGKAAQIPADCRETFGAFCKVIRPNAAKVVYDYVAHYFQSDEYRHTISNKAAGANINNIRSEHLDELTLPLPPLAEQKRIAEVLDKISAMKRNAEARVQKLDLLVKSRFVEMFGDGTKWQRRTVGELCEFITDGEHATPRRVTSGIYLLSARNVHDHKIALTDVDYIDEAEYSRIAKRIIPKAGDILLSCSGSVGRCCAVPEGLKFQLVRSVALLRFSQTILPKFAEYLLCSQGIQAQINTLKTASSQANLFQGKIRRLIAYEPPLALQRKFAAFVEKAEKLKATAQRECEQVDLLYRAKLQEYFG